jgi:hypothetical protein
MHYPAIPDTDICQGPVRELDIGQNTVAAVGHGIITL